MGQSLPTGEGPVTFTARAFVPDGGEIVLIRNGPRSRAPEIGRVAATAGETGAYRVEVHVPAAPGTPPVPWVVSNPIYVLDAEPPQPPACGAAVPSLRRARSTGGLKRTHRLPAPSPRVRPRFGSTTVSRRVRSQSVRRHGRRPHGSPTDANAIVLRLRASTPDRVSGPVAVRGRGARRIASVVRVGRGAAVRATSSDVSSCRAQPTAGSTPRGIVAADRRRPDEPRGRGFRRPRGFRGRARPGPLTQRARALVN